MRKFFRIFLTEKLFSHSPFHSSQHTTWMTCRTIDYIRFRATKCDRTDLVYSGPTVIQKTNQFTVSKFCSHSIGNSTNSTSLYSYGTSSRATTNAAFSIASKLMRLVPLKKYVCRVSAHSVRLPAVSAANFSSPLAGDEVSSRIICICLKNFKKILIECFRFKKIILVWFLFLTMKTTFFYLLSLQRYLHKKVAEILIFCL